jgi:hypothetical protein
MSESQDFMDLHSPDESTRLRALQKLRTEDIQDQSILLAIEAIMHDDPSPRLQDLARQTLENLNYELTPQPEEAEDLFQLDDSDSEREMLVRTLLVLESQQKLLQDTLQKIGCLYQFMILMIVLIVLRVIVWLWVWVF